MNYIEIQPSKLEGEIRIPPSKSLAHRALICAGLSDGISHIHNVEFSDDIIATSEGIKSLGAEVEIYQNDHKYMTHSIRVKGIRTLKPINNKINCNESGSTLRFLIPIFSLTEEEITFTGEGKLVERPLDVYYRIFNEQKIQYSNNRGNLPLTIRGKIRAGEFQVNGSISSQFISGLMFALPLLSKDSIIHMTTDLESKGYVDLTIDMLKRFDIEIQNKNYGQFYIPGNQRYKATEYIVPGDYSQGAFWIVAGILGVNIKCRDLEKDSLQSDKAILDIVNQMDGNLTVSKNSVTTSKSKTKGITIDASQFPDIVPILAVLASLSEGTTRIINAQRLRIKESDRLKAISTELNKLGADIEELADGLLIKGKERLNGGVVESWGDHRIAMALAIASISCKDTVTIQNSNVVTKSYPKFWADFKQLGGNIIERTMGQKY